MSQVSRGFILPIDLKHPSDEPITSFFSDPSFKDTFGPKHDLSQPIKILQEHWVRTVGDLRLLCQEGYLRFLGLPLRLCKMVEDEVVRLSASSAKPGLDRPLFDFGSSLVADASIASANSEGIVIRYDVQDFSGQLGLFYFLGTLGLTRPWTNPCDLSAVRVTCSAVLKDSVEPSALVGRELVRFVATADSDRSVWVMLELLGDRWFTPTKYTLRHYASWDTEALRSWTFEASADQLTWYTLRQHDNDESLQLRGSSCTWEVSLPAPPAPSAFRFFRVVLTGPNSNKHLLIALSAIDMAGTLFSSPPPMNMSIARQAMMMMAEPISATPVAPSISMGAEGSGFPPAAAPAAAGFSGISAVASAASSSSSSSSSSWSLPSVGQRIACRWSGVDFDDNGAIYWLGTLGGSRLWANPAQPSSGPFVQLVRVEASALNGNSEPAWSVTGRTAVRCVTTSQPMSWFSIELLGFAVCPTHYSLRHYSSWDVEALRSWELQACNDGSSWQTLMSHSNDASLNTKGATHTWPLPQLKPSEAFKFFRVLQTGENSNHHLYLALSGFELYGTLVRTAEEIVGMTPADSPMAAAAAAAAASPTVSVVPAPVPVAAPAPAGSSPAPVSVPLSAPVDFKSTPAPVPAPVAAAAAAVAAAAPVAVGGVSDLSSAMSAMSLNEARSFVYTGDMDRNGIVYYYGTGFGTRAWSNPCTSGLLEVTASSLGKDSVAASCIVGLEAVRCVTLAEPSSWFAIDFGRLIMATHYTLRHYSSWDTEALRTWQLQGSSDGTNWTVLSNHVEDASLDKKGATHTWPLQAIQPFSRFRVYQTGLNSNKHHYLALSGFEIYGTLFAAGTPALPFSNPIPFRTHSASSSSLSSSSSASVLAAAGPSPAAVSVPVPFSAPVVPAAPAAAAPVERVPTVAAAAAANMLLGDKPTRMHQLTWDPAHKGPFLEVNAAAPSILRNTGSSDKWQVARSVQSFSSGRHAMALQIGDDAKTSNIWKFIVGVVPTTFTCVDKRQWVGAEGSWGYIAGTGGKCFNEAKSYPYGQGFTTGDVIGIVLDFDARTIEFFKNGVSQGIAFDTLTSDSPIHVACSLTGTNAWVRLVEPSMVAAAAAPVPAAAAAAAPVLSASASASQVDSFNPLAIPAAAAAAVASASVSSASSGLIASPWPHPLQPAQWDVVYHSPAMAIDERAGTVTNTGSADKWQSARSAKPLKPVMQRAYFEVEIASNPKTSNSWQIIVGVVPSTFTCQDKKLWVGAEGSWGYIGGTGGKCFMEPKSIEFGSPYGISVGPSGKGDVVGVLLDWTSGTIEFFKNGISQGIAFRNFNPSTPVHAAVSLTATGAVARIRM